MERNRKADRGSSLSKILLLAFLAIIPPGTFTGVTGNGHVVEGVRLKHEVMQLIQPSSPLFFNRVKRGSHGQNEKECDSSSEEVDEQNCTRLCQTDAKPPSSGPRIQINLLNLLSQGSDYMVHDDSVKDVILIVGNTGCGKTTFTQMVAGDLTRLHAVRTNSRRLLIMDDDNRIGLPSTISKMLVPELIRKREENGNVTIFYDCPGFDDTRGPEEDIADIMKGVTEFLQMYLTDLHSQSNSSRPSPIPEDDVGRKIEFVSALLEQNGRNKYGRISFSKSPIKCGPLSESPVVSDTRNRILSFYATGLDYSPVNHPKDFGYTLKADSKLKLITHVEALNGNVTVKTAALMDDFKATFDQQLSLNNDLIIKLKMVRNATATLTEIDTSAVNLGNSSNPEAFLQILDLSLNQIGYEISPNFTHFMEYQQSIFDFFDEANAQPIHRNMMSWLSPVKAVNAEYAKLEEEAKLALRKFVASQNKEITNEISTLMGGFEEWFTAQYLPGSAVQLEKAKVLENSATALGKLVVSLKTLGSKSYPTDFLSILKASLNGFGYNISIDLEEFMKLKESYFRYDDEVNPPGVIRTVNDWKEPILKLRTTLKGQDEKLKKDLRNQVESLDVKMEQGISSLLTEFKDWYEDKHLKTTNLSQITKELRNNPTRIIKGLVTALNSSEAMGSSELFLRRLRSSLEGMGYIVPPTVEAIERERQRHLDLFKELASPPTVNSNFDKWIELVEKVKEQFEDLLKWYNFCEGLEVETTMGTYAWQSNKPAFPKTKVDWLDFLGWGCPGCGIQVGSEIQLIKAKLARAQEDVLDRIMEFALKPVEIKCDRENATVTGNYVRLSEFISGRPLVGGCYSDSA